jgi:CxxC motif-containing protein (DUF1111 family)
VNKFVALTIVVLASAMRPAETRTSEAPSGFDNVTNGLVSQSEFDAGRRKFEDRETIAGGLGPLYNADSCAACHAVPVTGGGSQIAELRAGHLDALETFVPHPGGSLIQDRAISPDIQRHVSGGDDIRALRASLPVLGLGYVEAIDDATLVGLAERQAATTGGRITGRIVEVPVLEASGIARIGRFGWKNQHASLLSFVGDAYLKEIGITNRLAPHEMEGPESNVSAYDTVPDPEDSDDERAGEQEIDRLTKFIRATKAPPPDAVRGATWEARAGAQIFRKIGCGICHVETLVTAPAGTPVNGGTFVVPPALGDKIIHPFSDFLLHDVGTGDGIAEGPASGGVMRTPPLWGLRARTRLMHDGLSLTPLDAVQRHRGEALDVVRAVGRLGPHQLNQMLSFLGSL